MGKFYTDTIQFTSEHSIENMFWVDLMQKKKKNLTPTAIESMKSAQDFFKDIKRDLWKSLKKKHPAFFDFPYELNEYSISNLAILRNYNHGIYMHDSDLYNIPPEREYKVKTFIIKDEAQLNRFIKKLEKEDTCDEDNWSISFTIYKDIKYNYIWENAFI